MFFQARKIGVPRKNVCGDVHFFAARMGKFDPLLQFFVRKIIGKGAKRKGLSAEIDGVCAIIKGKFELLKVARRGKKFLFHDSFSETASPSPIPRISV